MGLRYGLLAVLTLVIASALAWDRLHPPVANRLFPRDEPARSDLAVVVLGGKPEPLPPPPPPSGSPSSPGPNEEGPDSPAGDRQDGIHRVEAGDTLGRIALTTMGSSRKAGELAKFNGISVDAPLKVGQEIRIPPAAPAGPVPGTGAGTAAASTRPTVAPPPAAPAKAADRTCRVGKGDTLFGLARKYYGDGGRYRDLAEANGLDPDQPLRVGTELKLP